MQKGDMLTLLVVLCCGCIVTNSHWMRSWDCDYSHHTCMSNLLNRWNSKTGEEQTTSLHWVGQWEIEDCIVFLLRLTFPSSEFEGFNNLNRNDNFYPEKHYKIARSYNSLYGSCIYACCYYPLIILSIRFTYQKAYVETAAITKLIFMGCFWHIINVKP